MSGAGKPFWPLFVVISCVGLLQVSGGSTQANEDIPSQEALALVSGEQQQDQQPHRAKRNNNAEKNPSNNGSPAEGNDETKPKKKKESSYLTAYACEGSRLDISCDEGLYLDIIRANYGRFSIAICNDHGNTDWSVNCMSPRTLRVIKARCGSQPSCNVPVDSGLFGDPCPGTHKYVEVHYECRKEPPVLVSPTPRPRPSWYPAVDPHGHSSNTWATINHHLRGIQNGNGTVPGDSTELLQPVDSPKETAASESESPGAEDDSGDGNVDDPLSSQKVIEVRVPKPFNYGLLGRKKPNPHLPIALTTSTPRSVTVIRAGMGHPDSEEKDTTSDEDALSEDGEEQAIVDEGPVQILVNFTQYCPPSTARGLFWNWTKAGDTAVLQCPSGSTGFAKWNCGSDSQWATQAPSFSECRSLWLGDLDSRLRSGVSVANISYSLAYYSGFEPVYGGDILLAARMLKVMAERMHYEMQRTSSLSTRESLVTQLVQNVVRAGSNLLARAHHRSWGDLGRDEVGRAATALLVGLEENAFLLAEAVTAEKIIIKPTENILLSIRVMQRRNAHSQRFPSVEHLQSWDNHGDSLLLSAKSLRAASTSIAGGGHGAVRVVFATYNQLDQLLSPQAYTTRIVQSHQGNASTPRFFLNSKVISASLSKGKHIELDPSDPVRITLKHLRTVNVSEPKCVFWDYHSSSWSGDGCSVTASNRTHTLCKCTHLTNFALLMREGGAEDDENRIAVGLLPLQELGNNSKGAHGWTIVVGAIALVCLVLLLVLAAIAWRRLQISRQCRSALEQSGLPCFHKGKDLSDKDKANKGNFYTVTPKMNGAAGAAGASGGANANPGSDPAEDTEANSEVAEAQQFFEHLQNLQKSQDTLVAKRRNTMSVPQGAANSGDQTAEPQQPTASNVNVTDATSNGYPRRAQFARALSPYNHIYMEIDPTDVETVPGNVYEPLSETYMMSTVSDLSEDYAGLGLGLVGGVHHRHSSSRDSQQSQSRRPLIRGSERNLLHTISGVLHSQSVRVNGTQQGNFHSQSVRLSGTNNGSHTLHAVRPQLRRSMLPAVRTATSEATQTLGRPLPMLVDAIPMQVMPPQQSQQPQTIPMQVMSPAPLQSEAPAPQLTDVGAGGGTLRPGDNVILGRIGQGENQQFVCLNVCSPQQATGQPVPPAQTPQMAVASYVTAATAVQPQFAHAVQNP